jgi:hypothetical protein
MRKGTYRTCDFFKWDDELLRAKDAKDVPFFTDRVPLEVRVLQGNVPCVFCFFDHDL